MADLSFSQPERPRLLLPILLALAVLSIAAVLVVRFTPHRTAEVSVTHVDLYPAHVVFKSDTRVVGPEQAEDQLYVFVTLRIHDSLRLPLFVKDFTATLVPNDGSLQPSTSALEHRDLENLFTSFPALRKLAAAQPAPPLVRESRIAPGQSAEGWVLLHFPVTPPVWNGRNDAVLNIDLYHQSPLSVSIPRGNPTSTPPAANQ